MRIALQLAITLALLLALLGLYRRGRLSLCWSFVPYSLAIIVCGGLAVFWPSRFFNPEFWLLKQAVYDVCKLAVAVELAYRALRAFPGAERQARRWFALILPGGLVLVATSPARVYNEVADWQLRALVCIVWLFTVTALAVLYYRLPVHVWHRALLGGFSAYLLIFGVGLQALRGAGWSVAPLVGLADGWAYLAVCCWWAVSAWRREAVPAGTPERVARRLGLEVA